MEKIPESGEIVVCKISKVLEYGVIVELLEYPGINGFVHISQVASSWIKNIRSFVKEGQVRAAEVLSFNRDKNQLDLSFTKVSSETQRKSLEEYKYAKRNQKLLEVLAKNAKVSLKEVKQVVEKPLLEKFPSLQEGFQEIAFKGITSGTSFGKLEKPLLELLEKNIEKQKKTVRGFLSLRSNAENGSEVIKNSLLKAQKSVKGVEIFYSGSGKFDVRTTASSFKEAEKALRTVSENALLEIKKLKGTGSFEKAERS